MVPPNLIKVTIRTCYYCKYSVTTVRHNTMVVDCNLHCYPVDIDKRCDDFAASTRGKDLWDIFNR